MAFNKSKHKNILFIYFKRKSEYLTKVFHKMEVSIGIVTWNNVFFIFEKVKYLNKKMIFI